MFLKPTQIAPAVVSHLLQAAEAAARAIPPAFPLDATVAVNPFLGQTGEDLAHASARLARVAGVGLTRPRSELAAMVARGEIGDDDLAAALIASPSPVKPRDLAWLKARLGAEGPAPEALPTVAALAAHATGTDWPAIIARSFGLWAAGYFDRGQALWTPRPGHGAFAAWREWATHDLTPEIAGLTGFSAHVAEAPDTADRAILRAADRLGLTADAAETAFHRLLVDLGGWPQHARWLLWQAELAGGSDATLTDMLAIRLVWEEALLAHCPAVTSDWKATVAAHAAPLVPSADQTIDAILQEAAERAHQRSLSGLLSGPAERAGRPALQAAFCIDVRSEVLRRALEAQDGGIETLGFAGFFGLPVAHRPEGTDEVQAHLPALLNPAMISTSHGDDAAEASARIAARAARAWGRFRQAAVSSFAFVEAAGPAYGAKLIRDALGLGPAGLAPGPLPRFEVALTAVQKAQTAVAVLRAMSLTEGHARLVLLVGHGAQVTNNPHESAYHCGACCGQTGEVSARLLAALLNDPETRAGLPALGLALAEDTLFVAGLHDTVTDHVTLYRDAPAPGHADDLARAEAWLTAAAHASRAERAVRLPGSTGGSLVKRAADWAEVRPEWGLAGCAAFIAAPRGATAGRDLQGRAFLHSYDWTADDGFATLELIITAPVVVASWISLQYYGSTVAPRAFGGGNKLIHNVVGGIGVLEGNGGLLRPGLPWQTVHDGERPAHPALRLSVMLEAPTEAITDILRKHAGVRQLFDNGWLHLFALENGVVAARYRTGLEWEGVSAAVGLAA
ncbi:YbcC family protein [Tabrizicola sp. BL-A-41-H6]|uniref:YbcC family protein n=1 Tax=Tabrizicola sp. BL-A-41-H6 TaxID=3421107 RepID=UPI003D673A2C